MRRMLICCGEKADTPLYMKEFEVSVSTIEELCYCFKKNLHMLEESIMREELCAFIEQQLHLKALAEELRSVIGQKKGLSAFVCSIMEYTGYLSQKEVVYLEAELKEVEGKDNVVRRKAKADFLLQNEKYARAAMEYDSILKEEVIEDDKIIGDIYHNLATLYSRMFYFDKAAKYYQMAYEKNKDKESYESYLLALHMCLSREEYVKKVADEMVTEETALALEKRLEQSLTEEAASPERNRINEISNYRKLGYVQEYYWALEKVFEEYKKEYRDSMSEG